MYETIRVRREGAIATVVLHRPEKRNALNSQLRRELTEAIDALAVDEEVRAVILTGAGDKAFAAGADVAEFATRTVEEQRAEVERRRIYDSVTECPKPVVAAIHGFCLGGGCELALACDIRVADETAQFGQPEVRIGLIPGGGGTQRLVHLVGPGQAFRIALTGDILPAEEAYRIGLVEFLTPAGEHVDTARELCERIIRWSPRAIQLIKQAVRGASELPLSRGLELERDLFLEAFGSADGREGVQAFVQKRAPVFTGR